MMKHITLLAVLLCACAAETPYEDGPVCGASEEETAEPVGALEQALTTCPGRPAGHKLLSPECPTCPILRLYTGSSNSSEVEVYRQACAIWDNAMNWNVCDVHENYKVSTTPTYGVVALRNSTYDLPGVQCSNGTWTAADWARHKHSCYRDEIRTMTQTCLGSNIVRVAGHEIGHALLRGNTDDGVSVIESGHDLGHLNSIMAKPTTDSWTVTADHKLYLDQLRAVVLLGIADLPCALRKVGC